MSSCVAAIVSQGPGTSYNHIARVGIINRVGISSIKSKCRSCQLRRLHHQLM